jgi:ethanolamine utilization protein EutA
MPHLHEQDDDALHHDGEEDSRVLWMQDNVVLHSVGIDVGSATTQVVFSRLQLRRHSEALTSRYVPVRREVIHAGEVILTPYLPQNLVDAAAIGDYLDREYARAGWQASDIDTGAVILTGEALRRRNAKALATVVASRAGDMVCVTAGHEMEALLAAHGSGAMRRSHDHRSTVLNVDIGGGTTKFVVAHEGRVLAKGAIGVGARLVALDSDHRIARLEPLGRLHARRAGVSWRLHQRVRAQDRSAVASRMADAIMAVVRNDPPDAELWLTEPVYVPTDCDEVVVSGGVSAYVHGLETRDFGDLGMALAQSLKAPLSERQALVVPERLDRTTLRATVLGAVGDTVQLSGITGWITDPSGSLPRRDLPVQRLILDERVEFEPLRRRVRDIRQKSEDEGGGEFVLAVDYAGCPSYRQLSVLARGIAAGLGTPREPPRPIYVLVSCDIAMTLGRLLHHEQGVDAPLVVLDGVELREFDRVDLGRVRPVSGNVPVTIKSLSFGSDAYSPALFEVGAE